MVCDFSAIFTNMPNGDNDYKVILQNYIKNLTGIKKKTAVRKSLYFSFFHSKGDNLKTSLIQTSLVASDLLMQ